MKVRWSKRVPSAPCAVETLERRTFLSVGGGLTNAGLRGEYYASSTLTGVRAFTRNDVRIDFDWGLASPGGSPAAPYNRVHGERFSVRWKGQIIPRFSETYTFVIPADDGVRFAIRPVGGQFKRLIDNFQTGQGFSTHTASYPMQAGKTYDVWLDYRDRGGAGAVSLQWRSPSTPLEVIDPVRNYNLGLSDINDSSVDKTFVDVWKTLRGYEKPVGGTAAPAVDAQGWPMGDFKSYLWDGTFLTGDQSGTYHLSFKGQADVTFASGFLGNTKFTGYNAATNTSTYDVNYLKTDNQIVALNFANTRRTADAAINTGVTGVQMLRPGYTAANTFTTPFKRLAEKYPILRFMSWTSTTNNRVTEWADRTLPGDNQMRRFGGKASGVAWEYVVQFANETGRDVWITYPGGASDDYLLKLAQLFKYGSDAVGNPYTSFQSDPVHPPLNPNLKIYLEYSNEVWNGGFYQHQQNLNAAKAEVAAGSSPLNYDGTTDENIWGRRRYAKRIVEAGAIFRSVFNERQLMTRVRPLLMWQYDNQNNSASDPLEFLFNYYDNGDQQTHVADPHPVSYYLFGAGQASYYRSNNSAADTVDGIFAGGIPDGSYTKRMRISAGWALSFGLNFMTYEGGLSLDTSANYTMNETQIAARLDPRTKDAEIAADTYFRELGGFSSAYYGSGAKRTVPFARTDNINNLDNPQLQAIDEMNRTLPPERTLGQAIPADIPAGEFVSRSPSWLRTVIGGTVELGVAPSGADRRGVVDYELRVDTPGIYSISFNTKADAADGQIQLFMDNQPIGGVVAMPTDGDSESRTIALSAGFHSFRLAWRAGYFTINTVKIHNAATTAAAARPLVESVISRNAWRPIFGESRVSPWANDVGDAERETLLD